MRRFLLTLAAGIAGAGLTLLAPSPAQAVVTPGAFCKNVEIGKFDQSSDGDWYQCLKKGDDRVGKWYPSGPPAGTSGPSVKPSASTSQPADDDESAVTPGGACTEAQAGQDASTSDGKLYACTKGADGKYTWVEVTQGGEGGALPKTGVNGAVAAGAGAALLGFGGLLIWSSRRRRLRFQA
jgi:LPXTG-motif cell wall-anchored protein